MHNIGIFGAARIAPPAVIEPAKRHPNATILGVASSSRNPTDYAAEHGIERSYDSYEAILADDDIDIIYNALPGHLHGPMTIQALEAGKHVLCEKPFSMNADEARRMVEAGKKAGKVVMEAFHNHYHPAILHICELKSTGQLGEIKSLKSEFFAHLPYSETELRHKWEMGGGSFMDLGCYALHLARSFMAEEPDVVSADGEKSESGVDESITANLKFPSGATGLVSSALSPRDDVFWEFTAEGSKGTLWFRNFCKPHEGHSIVTVIDGVKREYTIGGGTTYDYQLDAFLSAIDKGTKLIIDGADSIQNMTLIDTIYQKAGFPAR